MMKKKDFLENYRNIETETPKYDNTLTEKIILEENNQQEKNLSDEKTPVGAEEKTDDINQNLWKYTRSLLMFYMENEAVIDLYNKTFNETKDSVSEQEIENLALTVRFVDALELLTEEKLAEFAKDNEIPVKSDKEKQVKLILHEISER